jgi:hypothetical protein
MKNAFSCFVFGSYQKFIPYYIFGINQNYENIDIIIFYEKTLNTDIKKYILEKKMLFYMKILISMEKVIGLKI